jgi:hypothetical protein
LRQEVIRKPTGARTQENPQCQDAEAEADEQTQVGAETNRAQKKRTTQGRPAELLAFRQREPFVVVCGVPTATGRL